MRKKIILIPIFMILLLNFVIADNLVLDGIYTDPAIIAAGDEVDIIIKFHDDSTTSYSKANDQDWEFAVWIEADDSLTEKYITIQDAKGDSSIGHLYPGEKWTQVFRIKVNNNALPGTYEFELKGQYEKNGVKDESLKKSTFTINVKKEGIILGLANIITTPAEVRPGDDYINLKTQIENAGSKDAKNVEIRTELPEGITASYSNDNRMHVGKVNAETQKDVDFSINIDDSVLPGVYEIKYKFSYMDLEDNKYEKEITVPIRIKEKPHIEVIGYEGTIIAGKKGLLKVLIKNTGTETAEAVDVRILKQSSQPFDMSVRSDYVGELEPDEIGAAIFEIKVLKDASVKDHDFKLLIRAKGDTTKGDDNIYIFNERAKVKVLQSEGLPIEKIVLAVLVGVSLLLIIKKFKKK